MNDSNTAILKIKSITPLIHRWRVPNIAKTTIKTSFGDMALYD